MKWGGALSGKMKCRPLLMACGQFVPVRGAGCLAVAAEIDSKLQFPLRSVRSPELDGPQLSALKYGCLSLPMHCNLT